MNSFIEKLIREGKIKLDEPSKDIAKSYLERSQKSLISSRTLMGIENFNDAVALTYYSMYYSSLALLYFIGIKSENHTGTILLLEEIFNINITDIKNAKKERVDKQYYVDFESTEKEVKEGINVAQDFNSEIKNMIDKMNQSELQKYFEKAKDLF
jgi:uncharacterized protein (UPF0332 family)